MSDHSDQLKRLRLDAGFASARAAALAMGVPVPTYVQHENGKRACSIAQFERYGIFFTAVPIVTHFLKEGGAIPDPEMLAALIYDGINRARHWSDAPPKTMATYLDVLEDVFRAIGINLPMGAFHAVQGHPESP